MAFLLLLVLSSAHAASAQTNTNGSTARATMHVRVYFRVDHQLLPAAPARMRAIERFRDRLTALRGVESVGEVSFREGHPVVPSGQQFTVTAQGTEASLERALRQLLLRVGLRDGFVLRSGPGPERARDPLER